MRRDTGDRRQVERQGLAAARPCAYQRTAPAASGERSGNPLRGLNLKRRQAEIRPTSLKEHLQGRLRLRVIPSALDRCQSSQNILITPRITASPPEETEIRYKCGRLDPAVRPIMPTRKQLPQT